MRKYLNNLVTFVFCLACILVILTLNGCSSLLSQKDTSVNNTRPSLLGNSELYVHQLANELFFNVAADRQFRLAVAGFVPVTTLKTDLSQQGPLMLLGHQLEQGLTTEAVRRGFVAQDFKAANSIIMNVDSDRALSRNLAHLRNNQNVDFYITGTITEQEEGAMVNARIINVRNKDVIAAATKFFPAALFWRDEQITSRNGMLYRTEKPPIHRPRSGD
ncbi:MAG: FlgO family outer membrane protein [Pseudomonadota bacterium]